MTLLTTPDARVVDAVRDVLRRQARPLGRGSLRRQLNVSNEKLIAAVAYLQRRREVESVYCHGLRYVGDLPLFRRSAR